jgi:hypothetical protein
MDDKLIYRKTDKGREEIASRAYRLKARERSLLFLVDGSTTRGQLLVKAELIGAAPDLLDHLLGEGFIETASASATASPKPSAAQSVAEPEAAADIPHPLLKEIAKLASHFLHDALGPDADNLTLRLESCRTLAELLPQLEKTRDVLQTVRGRRKAEEYWQALAPKLQST